MKSAQMIDYTKHPNLTALILWLLENNLVQFFPSLEFWIGVLFRADFEPLKSVRHTLQYVTFQPCLLQDLERKGEIYSFTYKGFYMYKMEFDCLENSCFFCVYHRDQMLTTCFFLVCTDCEEDCGLCQVRALKVYTDYYLFPTKLDLRGASIKYYILDQRGLQFHIIIGSRRCKKFC